tara:strand:- start:29 stop:376 length:348 start_codon:yes stop_codon:yes gene_type:complete
MSTVTVEAKNLLNKIQSQVSNKQSAVLALETQTPIKKGETMSDSQAPIYVEKNRNTDVMIATSNYKGKTYLNIRECWLDARNPGARNPTKKGVTLSIEKLDEVIEGLNALRDRLG